MSGKIKAKYSFGVLKPDCIRRKLTQKAFQIIEKGGLKIIYRKDYKFSKKDVEHLYERCLDAPWIDTLVEYMTSNKSILYIAEIKDCNLCAITTLNDITGFRIPEQAKKGTLRRLGESVKENISHSTSDIDKFWYEVEYFFTSEEIKKLGIEKNH